MQGDQKVLEEVFQFPSNGKAYPKVAGGILRSDDSSTSFNSLQTGKHIQRRFSEISENSLTCFNSLQTGKHIQRWHRDIVEISSMFVSIPFKRESISKDNESIDSNHHHPSVSIPFKRESISKGDGNTALRSQRKGGFNSLQTGKAYPKFKRIQKMANSRKFQFPSNGKAYPKKPLKGLWNNVICFNSLQTGKHIQRAPILSPVEPWLRTPKNKRELRRTIFERNFSLKIPQTHVCIDRYAIF